MFYKVPRGNAEPAKEQGECNRMPETEMHSLYVSIGSVPISKMTPFVPSAHFARFYLRFNWIDFGRFLFFSSFPIPFRNWGSVEEGNRLCVRSLVRVLIVTLSYGARNVLSFTRSKMTNFLAFRDNPMITLRRSPSLPLLLRLCGA